MKRLPLDTDYLLRTLRQLLEIYSPSGYTDQIVHFVGDELSRLGIPFELTRRGAIRANLAGKRKAPARAIVSHLDTLGALIKNLKPNGRLEVVPIGSWSSRFAEGARVSIFTDVGVRRGSVLPLKASGHTFNDEIDTQPVSWQNVEIRVDELVSNADDLLRYGFAIGDVVAFDPNTEIGESGFINSRHLDNKAGVASMLAAAQALLAHNAELLVDCHLLFTISEEVGSGASAVLHGNAAEMVAVDNATPAPGQNSSELGVTIAMADSTGPFDYHLSHRLLELCRRHGLPHQRDVFRYYRCDAASALEAGNDIRTALVCFGADGSHGYERTHVDSLVALADLLTLYMQSDLVVPRDRVELGPLRGFPRQPVEEAPPGPNEAGGGEQKG